MQEKISQKQMDQALTMALLQLLKEKNKVNKPTYIKVKKKCRLKSKEAA